MSEAEVPDRRPADPGNAARPGVSRRALLGAAAAGTAGLLVGRIAGPLVTTRPPDAPGVAASGAAAPTAYPFFGARQAGVTTPAQDHIHLAAFDMLERTDRGDLVSLLRDWSYAASRMTDGLQIGTSGALGRDPDAPADDTGEALDLTASRLTVTIGFGPGLFGRDGGDPYGIAAARPPELEPLPPFIGDALKAARSDGDLCVQACADDPQVALHAIRNLTRIALERAAIRWSQTGFGRTSTTSPAQHTPRNLMGFRDGTNNIRGDDEAVVDQHVWLPSASVPSWLAGGTYLVARKIEILIEDWDREPLAVQQATFGRTKRSGAPLSGGDEFTSPDFEAQRDGADAIDRAAHLRLAHPSSNGGIRILRRSYNYLDGTKAGGRLDAGLLFIAYQRSPSQFIALQRALGTDLLNDYIRHIGSAIFAVPPGASAGGFVGETLLG
jgi:deferrochelatase/peroxidase EfeB